MLTTLMLYGGLLVTYASSQAIAAISSSSSSAAAVSACSHCATPHKAAQQAHLSCLKWHLEQGTEADISEPSTLQTPLHYAAQHNFDPTSEHHVLAVLIAEGAKLNSKNFMSYEPCHIAALYNCPDTLALLLDAGANGASKTRYDDTPLDFAIFHNYVACIKALIIRGFITSKYTEVVENYRWDPFIRLQRQEYKRMQAYLQAHKERRDLLVSVCGTQNIVHFLYNRELHGSRPRHSHRR